MDLKRSQTHLSYRYEPLETTSCIRVLALNQGSRSDALQGSLQQFDLACDNPSFEALSYVWGELLFTQPLEVDGKELYITVNLEIALRRIRSETQTVLIWADQICIDQNNLQERATQVGLMGRIYATAGPVVTWLGLDPTNSSQSAFGALRHFATSPDLYGVNEQESTALVELSQCAYFSRLWVIQEITNSSHKAGINRVLWGVEHELTVQELMEGLYNVVRLTYMSPSQWKAFRWLPEVIGHDNIFEVLAWVRSRQCSDDRDRIYGIIRITLHEDGFWNGWIEKIVPDYTLTSEQVYQQTALRMIECGATAFMLNSVHHEQLEPWGENAWPSWVPRWNEDLAFDFKMFKFKPEEKVVAEAHGEGRHLYVQCLPTGVVTECSDSEILFENSSINFPTIYTFWNNFTNQLIGGTNSISYLWRQVHFACVFSSPAQNGFAELDKCAEMLQTASLEYKQLAKEDSECILNTKRMLDTLDDSLVKLRALYKLSESEQDTPNLSAKETFRGRRLFSATGGQVGVGPTAVRNGDIVVQIPGSQTPFILRQQGSFYQFVGAASIPTTLRLTAIEHAIEQEKRPQRLEIR